jgi:hypothetical protein
MNRAAPVTGLWGVVEIIGDAGAAISSPSVGLDDAGNAVVVWQWGTEVWANTCQ